ncbi:ABC transporter substrate-binding protein [Neorhizobium sp. NCHU2750]|uniref:ABC transporter substrate-binding protein n=1 Tax=Neorhizobium sp. NCHU2750 TaxID=1825976 RepID=UPI000E7234A8|nr:peptide/nickel ABC transporter substrate-binding protein [Neorhizobium sp. NCHU2750]
MTSSKLPPGSPLIDPNTLIGCSMSRRMFTGGLLAGGLATMMAPGLGYAQAVETPKRGGSVKLALVQQTSTDTFDSARYDKGNDYIRGTSVYSYLTTIDRGGAPQPEVATQWEPNADATVWNFKFRQGITFTDGSALTAKDIAFSIMRHKDPAVASTAKQLVGNIQSVDPDGTDGFTVKLATPDVDLPILVGLFQFALVKAGTTDFSKPIGTGAFTVEDFQPGLRTVLVKNPNYWKEGQPYIDRFEMFPIPDNAARANALLSGDVDMVLELRGNGIQDVEASSVADVFVTESTRFTAVQALMNQLPSSNVDLTLAIAHLIDRKRLLDTVIRGYGTIANDQPIGPSSPLYNHDLEQRGYDLDKAKYHFQKSGIGQAPFEVSVSDAVLYSVDLGQLIQREASRAGMKLSIRREPSESYWSAVAGKKPYATTNFHPRPTYGMLLNLAWRKGAVWNFSHYENDKLEKLIVESGSTLDMGLRKEQYADIQTILHNSGAIIIPCFLNYVDGVSKKIKGMKPLQIGNLGGFNFTDKIWIDA